MLNKEDKIFTNLHGFEDPFLQGALKRGIWSNTKEILKKEPNEIIELVKASQLRGRGGAGFSTGLKWSFMPKDTGKQHYLVVNADESEPGTCKDREMIRNDPHMLIEGCLIASYAIQATKCYIYIRGEYFFEYEQLEKAIKEAYDKNFVGKNACGSDFDFDIYVHRGAGAYICGEETSLLESLEGKRGMVRAKPPLPAIEGLFGKPTVVNNVLTLGAVATILEQGSKTYKDFGMGRSRGTLAVQLAGNVKRGGVIELAFGVTLREVVEGFGCGTYSGRPIRAIQMGGPLGAFLPESQWDTPLDYESFAAIKAMIGHGGIVVFDDTVDMAAQARFAMEFCAVESCGKCTPCRIGATRGVEVIDRIVQNQDRDNNLILLIDLCDTMELGSLCAMGGMTPFPVRSALTYFTEDFGGESPREN